MRLFGFTLFGPRRPGRAEFERQVVNEIDYLSTVFGDTAVENGRLRADRDLIGQHRRAVISAAADRLEKQAAPRAGESPPKSSTSD